MIKNLTEKRAKLLVDARALMTGDAITAETRTKADGMIAEAEVLRGDIERIKATEPEAEAEQRSRQTPPRGQVEQTGVIAVADERSFEQRNKASNLALRSFMRGEKFEQRDLTVAANGGVMIPVAAVEPVQAQRSAGSIYDIVRKLRTNSGEDVRVPLWDDTANGFVLDSTCVGTNDPAIAGVTVKVDGLRSNPILIDNKLIQDLDYDLVTDVNQAIQKRYLRSVSQNIVLGNASNFVALEAISALTTATIAKLGYADLVELMTALDPAYAMGAAWSMSNATLGVVLQIVDGNGRPIFMPFTDGATSGFAGTIFGYPVKIDQFAPTVATGNEAVRFGDHAAAYTLREVTPGIVIKQSADRWIELNRLGVVAFARAGGSPTIASTVYAPLVCLTVK
jgi:HK97 family phage major capsid protein